MTTRHRRSAAWALSLRPTAAFAVVTMAAVVLMYFIGAHSIRQHNDVWLRGEGDVLHQASVAAPHGASHASVMRAIAASAAREVTSRTARDATVMFFLEVPRDGRELIWFGPEPREPFVAVVQAAALPTGKPRSLQITGQEPPFRVIREASVTGDLYLGLSDVHALQLMKTLLGRLALIWLAAVALAWTIAFASARRLLARVESITTVAAGIRSDDLSTRIPGSEAPDEIGYLARTLNGMLDRVAGSVNQLRSLTDTVAHELKTPVTSIRGRLENALAYEDPARWRDTAILAIEDLDRLAAFVTTSLDISEAEGGGLRIHVAPTDFAALVRDVVALYEPAFVDRKHELWQTIEERIVLSLDQALMQRAVANLLDNELRHTPPGTRVSVSVAAGGGQVTLRIEDDGPGFPSGLQARMFERFVKNRATGGHGLGLAFTRAIVMAHGGAVSADNRPGGGACLIITFPR